MRKRTILTSVVFILALAWSVNAHAESGDMSSGWNSFWHGVGHFAHNAMPWNWHEWAGK